MSFFDNLGKKITDVSQSTIQKTKEVSETFKLNTMISDEERSITQKETEIGKQYMAHFAETPDEILLPLVNEIKASQKKISELQAQIATIKNMSKCSNCGNDVSQEALFCPVCGEALVHETVEAEAISDAVNEPSLVCQSCGNPLLPTDQFCTVCGEKVVNPLTPQSEERLQSISKEENQ